MRLINTTTLELREFFDENIPEYAILSHRWGPDEVSYEEYLDGKKRDGAGYQKILNLCWLARTGIDRPPRWYSTWSTTFEWAWIDTICIDKRSSAELSEAINSMFMWYRRASVCLVFLPDVTALGPANDLANVYATDIISVEGHSAFSRQELIASVWFTRGWTAQELIAPECVLFFDTQLRSIGWRHDDLLVGILSEASRVVVDILAGKTIPSQCCIAQRFSWVSRRTTARKEDMAYCLLGICQVNMPLLYGEGLSNAFKRLQLEIIASSVDDSIFAFQSPHGGMLANDPTAFDDCSTLTRGYAKTPPTGITRTQRGIEFELRIPQGLRPKDRSRWFAPLILSSISTTNKIFYVAIRVMIDERGTYADGCIRAERVALYTFEDDVESLARDVWRKELQRPNVESPFEEDSSVIDLSRQLANRYRKAETIRVAIRLSHDY